MATTETARDERRQAAKRGAVRPGRGRQLLFAYGWLTPILAIFTTFTIVPIVIAIWLSLHRYNQLAPVTPFVGLRNFTLALTGDPLFLNALGNTLKYAAVAVPVNIVLALAVSLALNTITRLRALFRTVFFLPAIASAVAVSLLWLPIYDPQAGWLNSALEIVGISGRSWLDDPSSALWAVMVAAIWQDLGYNVIVFLAGLQAIPQEFYDVAKVDGAGVVARFRRVTLPLLRRTFVFVLCLTTIGYLQEFTRIQVMTAGGPIRSSETVVLHIYERAFGDFQMGYASAMSVLLMFLILVVALVQLRTLRTRWEY
ncbi:MAG TPA: sugar ABC transporter permease [Actinopolymorphaceae bacterium]|jgi:ABC-type sugar transport system permease subunit